MKFIYTVDPQSDEPIVLVNKWIGNDEVDGPGIMGDQFQSELLELDRMGKKRIQVWINSPGGVVTDGYSMYNAILKSKTKVDTYCVGIAASIAGVIFQAGRKRIMSDYGMLMYHNPFSTDGKKDEQLEMMRRSIIKMVTRCGSKTEAEIEEMMDRTTWILADEALESGMCDEIEVSKDYNKRRVTVNDDARAIWSARNTVLNKILNKQKNQSMEIVNKMLGLSPDASEAEVALAVKEMQNKIKNKKNDVDDDDDDKKNDVDDDDDDKKKNDDDDKKSRRNKKNDVDDDDDDKKNDDDDKKNEELDSLRAKLKKAEEDLDKMRAKNKATRKAKAESDADAAIKAGKIKAETKAKWVALLQADEDGEIINMINDLPVNKIANKIQNSDNVPNESNLTNVVARAMADLRIQNKI